MIPETLQDLLPAPQLPDIPVTEERTLIRDERAKMRAFEIYVSQTSPNLAEIARQVGCSKQYLYQISKDEHWVERKAHMAIALNGDGQLLDDLMEYAQTELRSKVATRLAELDEVCRKKGSNRLRAILAWLEMAGVGKEVENPMPRSVSVHNDLSDRRQVTVVQGPRQEELEDVSSLPVGTDSPGVHTQG